MIPDSAKCYGLNDLFRSDNSSESTVRGTSFNKRKFRISDQRSPFLVLAGEHILFEIRLGYKDVGDFILVTIFGC